MPRSRRPADAVWLLSAMWVAWATERESGNPSRLGQLITDAVDLLPAWVGAIFAVGITLGTLYAIALVAGSLVAARKRGAVLGDMVVSAALALTVGLVLGRLSGDSWPLLRTELLDWSATATSFPVIRVALLTAVVIAARPHMSRPMRRLGAAIVAFTAVSALVQGFGAPSDVVGGLAVGAGAAAMVHLLLGSPLGTPSPNRVGSALRDLGIETSSIEARADRRDGVSLYDAVDLSGRRLEVKVYGRDAAQTQFLAKVWRTLWYHDRGTALSISRRQQVEHEGFLGLMAARAGVSTAEVAAAGAGGADDALIAAVVPPGRRLAELSANDLSSSDLERIWHEFGELNAAGIAHGALDGRRVLVDHTAVSIIDFDKATLGAPDERLDSDGAGLLVAVALQVGIDRAVASALGALEADRLAEVLPYLQSAALTPESRREVRDADFKLKDLRSALATAVGTEAPKLEKLRRVTSGGVAGMALVAFVAWILVSQLAQVDLSEVSDELSSANWAWLVVALLVAQAANVPQSFGVMGAAPLPLPLGPTTALQFAINFINLAVPSSAGRIAMKLRFLQKFGVGPVPALAQASLDSMAGFVVQILFLLILLPITDISFNVRNPETTGVPSWVVPAFVGCTVVVLVSIVVVRRVPRLRDQVVPPLQETWESLKTVFRSGRKTLMLFGGNAASQVVYSLALGASVHAFGGDLSIADLVVINTFVSLFAGLMPVPGGIGVSETALTAGMIAAGLPQSTAVAAAITHRLVTYYLPPIWGWFALNWLRKRDYL